MSRRAQAFALLLTLAALPSKSQAIKIHMHEAGGYAADGMLYKPPGQPPFAALVLIPNEDGITELIQQSAQRFAAAGYLTVAVDPHRGLPGNLAEISEQEQEHDVQAALAFIGLQTAVWQGHTGAVGWGSGGRFALRVARESKVQAVVLEDPVLSAIDTEGAARIPVLVNIAGRGAPSSAQLIAAIKQRLHASVPDVKIYADAERGFENPSDPIHFRLADAKDVHQRQLSFLAKRLAVSP